MERPRSIRRKLDSEKREGTRQLTPALTVSAEAIGYGYKVTKMHRILRTMLFEVGLLLEEAQPHIEGGVDFYREVTQFEINLIHRALLRTRGHRTRAAGILGLRETTLQAMIKRYGIDVELLLKTNGAAPIRDFNRTGSELSL